MVFHLEFKSLNIIIGMKARSRKRFQCIKYESRNKRKFFFIVDAKPRKKKILWITLYTLCEKNKLSKEEMEVIKIYYELKDNFI